MAVSVQDLINKKSAIASRKKELGDLETSIGTVVIRKPSRALVLESIAMESGEGDKYLILESVVEPDLKDKQLQEAFGCGELMDIVDKIFESGEIPAISRAITNFAGYGKNLQAQVHGEVKN